MDAYTTWTSPSAGAAARRRDFHYEWQRTRAELTGIEQSARFYLLALANRRDSTYMADAVKRIDDHAYEFAGSVLDLISDIRGEAKTAADEAGIDPDTINFDEGFLWEQFEMWKKRSEARKAGSAS